MTTFAEHVDDYLRLRRALGFKLEEHARLLPKFAAHLEAVGAEVVTLELALGWAVQPVVSAGSVVPAMRLLVVRGFARYLAGIDPLDRYAALRDRICPRPPSPALFLSRNGTRLRYQCVRLVFLRLVAACKLEDRSPGSRPRPHSLRHSFAVNTLRDWHADGLDVQARLPLLTTHMGHVTPASTYYYLTAAPDLLAVVAKTTGTHLGKDSR